MDEKNQHIIEREMPEPIRKNLNRFKYVLSGIPLFYLISIYLIGWSFETLCVYLLLGLTVYYFYFQKRKLCLNGRYIIIEGLVEEIEDNYIKEKLHEFLPLYKQKDDGEGKKLVLLKLDGYYVRIHLGSKVKNIYRKNTAIRIYAVDVTENPSGMDEIYDYLAIVEVPVEELEERLNLQIEKEKSQEHTFDEIIQEYESI